MVDLEKTRRRKHQYEALAVGTWQRRAFTHFRKRHIQSATAFRDSLRQKHQDEAGLFGHAAEESFTQRHIQSTITIETEPLAWMSLSSPLAAMTSSLLHWRLGHADLRSCFWETLSYTQSTTAKAALEVDQREMYDGEIRWLGLRSQQGCRIQRGSRSNKRGDF